MASAKARASRPAITTNLRTKKCPPGRRANWKDLMMEDVHARAPARNNNSIRADLVGINQATCCTMNEAQIQRAVLAHLRIRGVPGLFFLHIPNGGLRLRSEAARLKGLGTRAGAPDLILIHEGRVYGLELKAPGG